MVENGLATAIDKVGENGMFGIYRLWIKKNLVGDGFRWLDGCNCCRWDWSMLVSYVLKLGNGRVLIKKREFFLM